MKNHSSALNENGATSRWRRSNKIKIRFSWQLKKSQTFSIVPFHYIHVLSSNLFHALYHISIYSWPQTNTCDTIYRPHPKWLMLAGDTFIYILLSQHASAIGIYQYINAATRNSHYFNLAYIQFEFLSSQSLTPKNDIVLLQTQHST